MEELNKKELIRQCMICKHVQQKKMIMESHNHSKKWMVMCSFNQKFIDVDDFESTPKECKFYFQRMMLSIYKEENDDNKKN